MAALLSREQLQFFIEHGYLVIRPTVKEGDEFHRRVCERTVHLKQRGENGNNLLPALPELNELLDAPELRGALTGLLGEDFVLTSHRHCHLQDQHSPSQPFHRDSYFGFEQFRHLLPHECMVFYYPQQVTEHMGPTSILPGSHYHSGRLGRMGMEILPGKWADDLEQVRMTTDAPGVCLMMHYHLWHRATSRRDKPEGAMAPDFPLPPRWAFKFQFRRVQRFGPGCTPAALTAALADGNPFDALCSATEYSDEAEAAGLSSGLARSRWRTRHAPLWRTVWSVMAGQQCCDLDSVCSRIWDRHSAEVEGQLEKAVVADDDLMIDGLEVDGLPKATQDLDLQLHAVVEPPASPSCGDFDMREQTLELPLSDSTAAPTTPESPEEAPVDDHAMEIGVGSSASSSSTSRTSRERSVLAPLCDKTSTFDDLLTASYAAILGLASGQLSVEPTVLILLPILEGQPEHQGEHILRNPSSHVPHHVIAQQRFGSHEADGFQSWLFMYNVQSVYSRQFFAAAILQALQQPLPAGSRLGRQFGELLLRHVLDKPCYVHVQESDWRLESILAVPAVLPPQEAVQVLAQLLNSSSPRVQMHTAQALHALAAGARRSGKLDEIMASAKQCHVESRLVAAITYWTDDFACWVQEQLQEDMKRRRFHANIDSSQRPAQLPDRGGRYALAEMLRCILFFGSRDVAISVTKMVGDKDAVTALEDCEDWQGQYLRYVERFWVCPLTTPLSPF
eukprot:TRINITY_DN26987_c0_g1_i1.p1 TRINITY_DN26987_c0_g1~~TRINITY_DN26987_c0_g1_i1.p1  ORF type:complete len:734 (-),score=122.23 TRINITY_DN26987_c0_g1_i1:364-2565(-)